MFLRFLARFLRVKEKGAFVIERKDKAGIVIGYFVRPSVIVLDGRKMRFRNFTDFTVTVDEGMTILAKPIRLAGKNNGHEEDADLKPKNGTPPGFYEYIVHVFANGDTNPPVEAIGDSRPGAIIDD